jgi:transposase
MEVLYPYCAGLDVHKETVVACVRRMIGGKVKSEVRTFATMTGSLLELSAWLGSEQVIQSIDKEVEGNLEPFRAAQQLLSAIPGISQLSACVILSEIGVDMSRFPTAGHLVSWAGLCPRNDESAGKRRSTRMRKGAPWLKTILIQCAWAAVRTKGSYFQAQYQRLRSRRGSRKAICAVAAALLTTIYHMLKNGTCYQDLGANHFDHKAKAKHVQRLVYRLENLGYDVKILPKAA